MNPMEFGDDLDTRPPLPTPDEASAAPAYVVLGMSLTATLRAALYRDFIPAVFTYVLLVLVGCGLLFYRRYLAIAATREAGGIGYVAITRLDRLSMAGLLAACLANGWIIANEMASWDWGS